MKKAKMELIDRGFSQKIVDKYTNLQLFSINFAPILSTKRIIPRMRWLELVFAMPYLILKREIFNSFKKYSFKPTFFLSQKTAPVKLRGVSLILQHLFTAVHAENTENTERLENQLLPGECRPSPFFVISALSTIDKYIPQKSDAVYRPYGHLEREALQNGQKIISYFNFKTSSMELAQPVSHETATTRIETEKESAFANYQLPVVTRQPPVVSHKPSTVSNKNLETYILSSTSDFIAPLFSYYSFKPTFFLSQKTVPVKQRVELLNLQKSDAALHTYGLLERETLQDGKRIISHFKSPSLELAQPISHETATTTRIGTEKELAFQNYQLPVVTYQPPVVSYEPSAVSNKNLGTYILTSTSDFIAPLFSYYSFKPLTTFFLSQKALPVKHREAALILQKSDASLPPYEFLERGTLQNGQNISSYFKPPSLELAQPLAHETSTTTRIETEKELAIANYQLPVVTRLLSTLSYKTASVSDKSLENPSILSSAEEFMNNKQGLLNTLEVVEKAPIYHTYPEIEHVTSTHTEIIKERVIEKEAEPPHATPQPPGIDVNRLAEQIYQLMERRVRIERERRGL